MKRLLIGITARKGVGKSTLARMLSELLPESAVVAFADALKLDVLQMVNDHLEMDVEFGLDDLERDKATIWGPVLQGMGELRRQMDGRDYWIERLAETLDSAREAGEEGAFIVADVRHLNEARWIRERGGLLLAIDGPSRLTGDTRSETHPSEAHVETIAKLAHVFRLRNEGSLDDLRETAQKVVDYLLGEPPAKASA